MYIALREDEVKDILFKQGIKAIDICFLESEGTEQIELHSGVKVPLESEYKTISKVILNSNFKIYKHDVDVEFEGSETIPNDIYKFYFK